MDRFTDAVRRRRARGAFLGEGIDVFVHDSDHDYRWMKHEFITGVPDYDMLFPHHTGHHPPVGFCFGDGGIAVDLEEEIDSATLADVVTAVTRRDHSQFVD